MDDNGVEPVGEIASKTIAGGELRIRFF